MADRGFEGRGDFDVVIVGAGFAGLYLLHRLRGMGSTARVLEAADGVGGTWYWNRYPGARCDVESVQYSLQFDEELQQDWNWTERYATQPEILRYANHVADRFDLRRDIQFETRVTTAAFDEAAGQWMLQTDQGARITAAFCIMATGCLSVPNHPPIDGLENFEGPIYHTAVWPHEEVDFTGQRVAVIGTGSSAIQSIPVIAQQAAHLTIFQRTPNYAVPAQNRPLDPETIRAVKADYPALRARASQTPPAIDADWNKLSALEANPEERQREFESRWQAGGLPFMGSYSDLIFNREANDAAADFVRGKIRQIVRDPAVADLLCPHNTIGAKRLCVDIGYYETYNRDNVALVDLKKTPIEAVNDKGVQTGDEFFEVDAIVLATGFDAMTGALLQVDIRGRDDASLREAWAQGPQSYLGLAVAGFPNLFTVTGPASPSVFTNMLPSIELHVEWITDCIQALRDKGLDRIEARPEAQADWMAHHREVAGKTLRSKTASWYTGANIDGKPQTFMPYIGGHPAYTRKCEEVAARDYEGFKLG